MTVNSPSKEHWDKVYKSADATKLGWYQSLATPSLELIERSAIKLNEQILDVGSGGSVLIDNLLSKGFSSIIANDISEEALMVSQKRLGGVQSAKVRWMVDDILNASSLRNFTNVALWHDRAVFHFFTKEEERNQYVRLLNRSVKQGGFVIIAAFNLESAEKCSGLQVERYNVDILSSLLGESYQLTHWFNYKYTMPSGDRRPYVYSLFRKLTNAAH